MVSEPVSGLADMLAGLDPAFDPETYVFCTTRDEGVAAGAAALAVFREDEGVTLVLPVARARALGFDTGQPMARIVLTVHSSLEGVGLTAAVASALAGRCIACNMMAAFHHDHVFVPAARAEEAMAVLLALQAAPAIPPLPASP